MTVTRLRQGTRMRLGRKRRGMTLIELMVGLLIISIAAVGTSIAVFNAYGQLQRQRHRLIANSYLRSEVEYWQGRIHTAMPTPREQNSATQPREVILDSRQPGNSRDDIIAEVRREPLRIHTLVVTQTMRQVYWEIPVVIRYEEPSWVFGDPAAQVEYRLVGYWLQSEPTNEL